jgi:hypothetical protein
MHALYTGWHDILVSSLTDRAHSMTATQGFATQIGACTPRKLICIWCDLHQLDLIMQCVFKEALKEEFYSALTTLIGHLW